jgi:hypothetical protein
MQNYKAPDNSIYALDSIEFEHMLPAGCIAITEAEVAALRPVAPIPTYQELRTPEYPPYTDYLDGVVKGDQAQIDKYIADCLAVKAKYPKGA